MPWYFVCREGSFRGDTVSAIYFPDRQTPTLNTTYTCVLVLTMPYRKVEQLNSSYVVECAHNKKRHVRTLTTLRKQLEQQQSYLWNARAHYKKPRTLTANTKTARSTTATLRTICRRHAEKKSRARADNTVQTARTITATNICDMHEHATQKNSC